jgi:hypothetical protein
VVQVGALVSADARAVEAEAQREAARLWGRMAAIAASER